MPERRTVRIRVAPLAAMALVTAVAGCGSSPTASAPPSKSTTAPQAAAGPAACAGSQLTLSYGGTEGATGHLELTLRLRNDSSRVCVVRGYPAARLLDAAGRPLPLRVSRGHGFFPDTLAAPRPVALHPGASARFGISFATNNEYAGAHTCRTAAAALSAPPGAPTHWQRVSLRRGPRVSPCGSRVVISPVHA